MASLAGWRFCPRCASALDVQEGEAVCPSCRFTAYAQSAPAVAAFIVEDGRALLGLRAHEPDAGRWDLLGGFLGEGEAPLDGLRRELREETGLEIEPGAYLGAYVDSYGETGTAVLNLVFEARVLAGDMAPADDVAELRWFDLEELPPTEELAFTWVARFFDDLESSQSPTRPRS
jgi:ADP-ribose pyrophosphatase YjhB (NUDIX family)